MSEVAMWAIGIILGVMVMVIGGLVKVSFDQLKNSFNELLKRIDKISDTLDSHNTDLIKILSQNNVQSQFIDDHTDAIEQLKRDVTKIQITCATNNHKHK